jgi:mycothiol synthase
MIRRVESEADLERCVEIYNAVQPDDPVTRADMSTDPTAVFLLDDRGGYALAKRSSVIGAAFAMVRVSPQARRRGIGSGLLEAATVVARDLGAETMWGRVAAADAESLGFVNRRGFEEVGRDVSLVRELRPDERPSPDGIDELRDDERAVAYEVYAEGVEDMPVGRPTKAMSFDEWCADENVVTLVARDEGRVVGYAELKELRAQPHRLEHGMTAVLRSHRRRGIASKLKQATITWAAQRGYRELVTYTQEGNEGMRTVNLRHGYVEVPASIELSRPL